MTNLMLMFLIQEINAVVIFCDDYRETENYISDKMTEHNIQKIKFFKTPLTISQNTGVLLKSKEDMILFKLVFGDHFFPNPKAIINWENYCLAHYNNDRKNMIYQFTGIVL